MKDLAALAPCNAPDWPTLPVVSHVIAEEDWRQLLRRAGHGAASSITEEATTSNRVLGNPPGETFVPIFKLDELAKLGRMAELAGSEGVRVSNWLARAMSTSGLREVRIPAEVANPGMLRERFPNFGAVIDYLEIQLALARYQRPQDFHITPILLLGPPGLGKTFFAEHLAGAFRTAMRRVSMASAQGGFELCGTSQFWSNSAPGAVFRLLAEHTAANGVLVLDELDKSEPDSRYSVEGPLLDLLEPRSSRGFRDQSVDSEFDASKLVIVATANDLGGLSAPIRSRFEVFEITQPDLHGREQIIRGLWAELLSSVSCKVTMRPAAARQVRDSNLSPRQIRRALRTALGRALRDGRTEITSLDLPRASCAHRIGF